MKRDAMRYPPAAPRRWAIDEVDLARYPHLQAAWLRSQQTIRQASNRLREYPFANTPSLIAASGSLGRMEQVDQSDADLIILAPGASLNAGRSTANDAQLVSEVWSALDDLGLPSPAADGIFTTACTLADLCDPASQGRISEPPAIFGKRIQLLLDAQPIFGQSAFVGAVERILERYAAGDVALNRNAPWTYLTNDLIRYYRCLAIDTQWRHRDHPAQWRLFNIKLEHSRRIMYAALLFLLGESSRCLGDRVQWLINHLGLTPLERIAAVYAIHDDARIDLVLTNYDRFLQLMADGDERDRLANPPGEPGRLDEHPLFREMRRNGSAIAVELTRFINARRLCWGDELIASLWI